MENAGGGGYLPETPIDRKLTTKRSAEVQTGKSTTKACYVSQKFSKRLTRTKSTQNQSTPGLRKRHSRNTTVEPGRTCRHRFASLFVILRRSSGSRARLRHPGLLHSARSHRAPLDCWRSRHLACAPRREHRNGLRRPSLDQGSSLASPPKPPPKIFTKIPPVISPRAQRSKITGCFTKYQQGFEPPCGKTDWLQFTGPSPSG
jgi:hypothetical protein